MYFSESQTSVTIKPNKQQKITLASKYDIAAIAARHKEWYDNEVKRLEAAGKVHRNGKWVIPRPKDGFLMLTVRETFPHLAAFGNSHPDVQAAKQVVNRALKRKRGREAEPEDFSTENPKKRFKEIGGGKSSFFTLYMHEL